ncbi:metallophosphoesterase family protein [Altererythrobacter sp.]|uniref:metallophosphoesterase family protein n=1 Tax=Altererythrobacter sp. TaxID=1872480 RepID=UPI001B2DE4FF|nr:metallophosphoesterase family protein [Altererythrobacter sp.]MBO6945352.1 serine/threonine protein phosphatase [Altererythrobacter sp.]
MVFKSVNNLLRRKDRISSGPRVPDGERYYVIGDIHGRLDLFDALIEAIESEISEQPEATVKVVLLGDLIDRGPDSAGVIKRAMRWKDTREVRILAGNHEEMFLQSFDDQEVLRHFLKHGGRETILSFGLSIKEYRKLDLEELFNFLPSLVPKRIRKFVAAFEEMIMAGDYVFVHAGINPEVALEDQKRSDLLWIRERFLRYKGAFPKTVVHGHTIFDGIEIKRDRIGLDTGAFRTGVLTALVLEGPHQRSIMAIEKKKHIKIKHEDLT